MKWILTVLFMMITLSCFSLNPKNVPDQAKNFVNQTFPQAKKVSWSKYKKIIEARFYSKEQYTIIFFDSTGKWINIEEEITFSEIPLNIKNLLGKGEVFDYVLRYKFNDDNPKVEYFYETINKTTKRGRNVLVDEDGVILESIEVNNKDYNGVRAAIIFLIILLAIET